MLLQRMKRFVDSPATIIHSVPPACLKRANKGYAGLNRQQKFPADGLVRSHNIILLLMRYQIALDLTL